jgi:hypothetical protein
MGYLCRDLPPKDDIDSTNLRIHTLILTTKSLYGHCSFLAQRSTPYNLIRLMSLPRTTGALSRSASAYIRFAALPPASRQCPQCLRYRHTASRLSDRCRLRPYSSLCHYILSHHRHETLECQTHRSQAGYPKPTTRYHSGRQMINTHKCHKNRRV